jgi:hypothetical protein
MGETKLGRTVEGDVMNHPPPLRRALPPKGRLENVDFFRFPVIQV